MKRAEAVALRRFLPLAALFALPTSIAAQEPPSGADDLPPPRIHAGGALALAQPRGEFADYVRMGGGLHAFFRVDMDEGGRVGLRVNGGVLTYGRETRRVCLSETVGCRIEVDLTTSHNILLLGVGPELGMPVGAARLYGNATVGLGYFSTDSQVSGTGRDEPFATTRNFGDGGLSWNAGAGIEIPLARVQRQEISLDFGVSYQANGRREYLTRGGITDRPDGSLDLDVTRSDADFLLWRIGISVGIRPEGVEEEAPGNFIPIW